MDVFVVCWMVDDISVNCGIFLVSQGGVYIIQDWKVLQVGVGMCVVLECLDLLVLNWIFVYCVVFDLWLCEFLGWKLLLVCGLLVG